MGHFAIGRCRSVVRNLYHGAALRSRGRRVMSYCAPWYFHKECPFCGMRLHQFEDGGIRAPVLSDTNCIGGGYRSNVTCPGCCSTDRERLIYLYLQLCSPLFSQGLTVLHVAPEPRLERRLSTQRKLKYLTADLSAPHVMIWIDLVETGLRSNMFDVIICNHVLEHICDDRKAMCELLRLLKPGGWAILQVPLSQSLTNTLEDPRVTDPKERLRRYGQEDHVRIYAASDYWARLEKAGFAVSMWSAVREFGEAFIRRYGLIRNEDLYVCYKPSGEAEMSATS